MVRQRADTAMTLTVVIYVDMYVDVWVDLRVGRVSRLKSTWAFQVGSSRYVAASPSELAGAVGFITSRLSGLESDCLTNKLAPRSLGLGIIVIRL